MPVNGINSAAMFMRPLMLKMQVIADNIANIDSTGFKKGRLFIEVLHSNDPTLPPESVGEGEYFPGVRFSEFPDLTQGVLSQTSSPFDFAIDGSGFFTVETPEGERYTRTGNFVISPEGEIQMKNGYSVLGENGAPLIITNAQNLSKEDIAVNPTGEIFVKGANVGKFKLVEINSAENLTKIGASLFALKAGISPDDIDPDKVHIRQGFIEGSNVDGIEEMIDMIELMRQFETGQKLIQTQDQSVNSSLEVGRLS